MGVNEAVHAYRSDAGSIPAASTNLIMITLKEFKTQYCDPITTYFVGVAIGATIWVADKLWDLKRCKKCDAWVNRNELYCKNSHKQF